MQSAQRERKFNENLDSLWAAASCGIISRRFAVRRDGYAQGGESPGAPGSFAVVYSAAVLCLLHLHRSGARRLRLPHVPLCAFHGGGGARGSRVVRSILPVLDRTAGGSSVC